MVTSGLVNPLSTASAEHLKYGHVIRQLDKQGKRRHPLYDSTGKRVENLPEGPGVVYLPIPENAKNQEQRLISAWTGADGDGPGIFESALIDNRALARRSDPEMLVKYGSPWRPEKLDLRVIYTKPGQRILL